MPSPELGVVAMKRREFITLVGGAAAAWPLAANAPAEGKAPPYRRMNPGSTDIPGAVGFYEGLLELGYTEGLNIAIERRYGDWNTDRFLQLAADLVRLKVDVIVVMGTSACAAKRAIKPARACFLAASIPLIRRLLHHNPPRAVIQSLSGQVRFL